jgi:hypothetical protein
MRYAVGMLWQRIVCGLSGSLLAGSLHAAGLTPEQQQWLESDSLEPPEFQVNLGELQFLATPPPRTIPQSDNTFIINNDSLETGWVTLRQCHVDLDPVPVLEVVYQYKQMRQLQIVEQQHIDKAAVVGNSVQMEDIRKGNRLCVEARIRILYREGDTFKLVNGPYHRRFLDGYYPYHVSFHVRYPSATLELIATQPKPQPGFKVDRSPGRIDIDAWFEGKLMTEMIFRKRPGSH